MGLILVLASCASAGPARATASEQAQLESIAQSDGPSAVASAIVKTGSGDLAVIAHALKVTDAYKFEVGSHTVVDAYSYTGSGWRRLASVDLGVNSPGPNIFASPEHVELTGSTDFLVTLEAAGASPVEIVSDAGGRWHVVQFKAPGQPPEPSVVDASVHGDQIISGVNDCLPNCAQGKISYTTWAYSRSSDDFRPVPAKPKGPCTGTLSVGPFRLTATCFTRTGLEWSAQGSASLDGIAVSAQGSTTITVDPASESISATGPVSVSLGSITIYQGDLNLSLTGSFSLAKKGKVTIKGLPISGNFQMTPTHDGMQVTAFAGVDGFTGNLTLLVKNDGSLDLTKLRLALGDLPFKQLVVKTASLTYQHVSAGDQWTGDVKVQLPGGLPSVDATLSLLNGKLQDLGASLSGINKPIGEVVFLQSLGLDLGFLPHLTATGSIGLTGGPKLPVVNAAAVALDASLEADFGSPVVLTANGTITVAGNVQLAKATAVWTIPNKLSFSGTAGFSLAGASVSFKGTGLVDSQGFGFFGNGTLSLPGHSGVQAFGYLSEKGVTSCGLISAGPVNVLLGFGYQWGGGFPSLWFDSCGALSFKSAAASSAARTAGVATTFRVPAGQRQTLFGATGAGGYPSFTLRSPTGAVINPAGATEGAVDHGGYVWVQDPNRDGTYVVVGKPTPGTWTLVPAPASRPITTTGFSLSAPPISVSTRVRRRGRRELLGWRASPVPGQTLEFSEVGARTAAGIVSSAKDHGSITFTPADDGTDAPRHIRIVVEVGGVPDAILSGAAFRPAPPLRPGRPHHVTLVRNGTRVVARWSAVPGADRYAVVVRDTEGRKVYFDEPARRLSVSVSPVLAPDRLTVSITGVSAAGTAGPPAHATLTLGKPARRRARGQRPPRL